MFQVKTKRYGANDLRYDLEVPEQTVLVIPQYRSQILLPIAEPRACSDGRCHRRSAENGMNPEIVRGVDVGLGIISTQEIPCRFRFHELIQGHYCLVVNRGHRFHTHEIMRLEELNQDEIAVLQQRPDRKRGNCCAGGISEIQTHGFCEPIPRIRWTGGIPAMISKDTPAYCEAQAAAETEPVTVIFVDRIRAEAENKFRVWINGIHAETRACRGFLDVTTIRGVRSGKIEFTTLLKFDTQAHLTQWLDSEANTQWVKALPGLLDEPQFRDTKSGSNPWFALPTAAQGGPSNQPALWKQTLLGIVTVYPMILLLNYLLNPIIGNWPTHLAILLVVVILSALLTYPIMPFTTLVLRRWL